MYETRRWPTIWTGVLLMLFSLFAVAPPATAAQEQQVHVVQAGETLWSVGRRYGVAVSAIAAANGLQDSDLLYVGQRLAIPVNEGAATRPAAVRYYVVEQGDTPSGVALRNGVTLSALLQANGLAGRLWVCAGQCLVIPNSVGTWVDTGDVETYVVRAGDSLADIAAHLDTTPLELARLNDIVDASGIHVGQVLRVPSQASVVSVAYPGSKRVLVDLSEQHLYAYSDDTLVYSFVCSSGVAPYYTRTGEFQVQSKIPSAYGATWGIWMPHWLGIYWAGSTENGIHALPIMQDGQVLWSGYLGQPVSYGCIVLGTAEAKLLYEWAEIGVPVTISP